MESARLLETERSCYLRRMLVLIAVTAISFAVVLTFPMTAQAETVYCHFTSTGAERVGGAMYEVITATDEWDEKPYRYAVYVGPVGKRKTSYTIPKTINVKVDGKRRKVPVKVIGRKAFKGCTKVRTVNCEAAIEVIEGRAFYGCAKLKTFKSNAPVAHVEKQAFAGCKNLTAFKCKTDRLHTIGDAAFLGCSKLKSVPRLAAVGRASAVFCTHVNWKYSIDVGTFAFKGCKSIKSVSFNLGGGSKKMGSRYVNIRESAFRGCARLSKISICGSKKPWQEWNASFEERSFDGCKGLRSISGLGKLSRAQAYVDAFKGTRMSTPKFESGAEGYFDLIG